MLRGPQTAGEVAGRGYRLHEFSGLEEVDETLNALIAREPEPLVTRLPRQAGQKEVRYAHLLSGEVTVDVTGTDHAPKSGSTRGGADRIGKLEQEMEALRTDMRSLQLQFEDFKKQFE